MQFFAKYRLKFSQFFDLIFFFISPSQSTLKKTLKIEYLQCTFRAIPPIEKHQRPEVLLLICLFSYNYQNSVFICVIFAYKKSSKQPQNLFFSENLRLSGVKSEIQIYGNPKLGYENVQHILLKSVLCYFFCTFCYFE